LAAVIEPRVEELFSLVHQVVRESGYEEVLSSGIVLTGGSAMMPGMVELAEDTFLKPARLGTPDYSGQLADVVRSPRYATVLGLLLEAKKQYLRGHIVTRQDGSVKAIWQRMKEWFLGNF
jgi:cell division protein FtsA